MESSGLDGDYKKFVKKLQTQFPNLNVIDGTTANYRANHFIDSGHLQRDGSIPYSLQIGKIIAKGVPTRWYQLPDASEWFDDSNLEDTVQ